MGKIRIEDILVNFRSSLSPKVKPEFLKEIFTIDLLINRKIFQVSGKLILLCPNSQILLSDVDEDVFQNFYINNNSTGFEIQQKDYGRFGLDIRRNPIYLNGPKMSLRAFFNSKQHEIFKIRYQDRIII